MAGIRAAAVQHSGPFVHCLGSGAQGKPWTSLELLLSASFPQSEMLFLNIQNLLWHLSLALSLFPFLAKSSRWQSENVPPFEPFVTLSMCPLLIVISLTVNLYFGSHI